MRKIDQKKTEAFEFQEQLMSWSYFKLASLCNKQNEWVLEIDHYPVSMLRVDKQSPLIITHISSFIQHFILFSL